MAETREAHPTEPRSTPVYVRLGMTRGAALAFVVVLIAGIAGFARQESLARDVHDTVNKARNLAVSNRATLMRLKVQERRNGRALREVCREGEAVLRLVQTQAFLTRFEIKNITSPQARAAYRESLTTLSGIESILQERASCDKVTNP